ncbi:HaeIII family restriction endonuclease [Candidatus Nomurabacteria bacterium]|nr:HaeIII family restriction endonuclease [Candidatus Nomurabacteria bacterium]
MATSMKSKQMITGKAFEYALLFQFDEKLKNKTNVKIVKNSAFNIAQDCFNQVSETEKSEYLLSASFAVNFLVDTEPRLVNDIDKNDILELEILKDTEGRNGDVRDVLAIRALQKWEIGVSAKNNHNAVKHSRLSGDIDFGNKWLGVNVSKNYFDKVKPIFKNLQKIREVSNAQKKWKDLGEYHDFIYMPILNAFMGELKKIHKTNSLKASRNLVSYLVGNKDFYKVIKRKNVVEIYAYNLYGTLNLPFRDIEPKYKTPIISLPTKILSINFKKDSKTTLIVKLNNDWVLSFRIHNASSRVEPSLKFDVNLLSSPKSLFKNTLNIIHKK